MDVKLVVLGGKSAGQEISVPGTEFIIGRAPECRLRPNSDMVSRRHCAIAIGDAKVTIRDLKSRNGTIVNGEKITGVHELRTGDKVKVGPLEFEVHLSTSIGGKKKPKVNSVQEAAARAADTARPRDRDADISDWLAEDDDDTKKNKLTQTFVPPTAAKPAETVPAPETQQRRIDPLADPAQKNKKPLAESSRVAAADMLKQFFKPKK